MTAIDSAVNVKLKNSGRTPLFFIVQVFTISGFSTSVFSTPVFTVLAALFLSACQDVPTQKHVTYSGPIMGTDYRISALVGRDTDLDLLEQTIVNAMQAVNQSMSTYIKDSEINQFNSAPGGQAVSLSPELAEVLIESLALSQLSEGAFDVTLARVINLWGFGPTGRISKRPSQEQLADVKRSVGYEKLSLDGDTATKGISDLSIDLSAIAKGYAVDKVADALQQTGVSDFLINIGGELRGAGRKIDGSVWQVGIEKPHALGGIQEIAALDNKAIATSGDYRNFYLIDGEQFSHTIDPNTLTPVFHKLALVSVIAQTAMRADGLATAMMAMGEARAEKFAEKNNLAAYMLIREPLKDQYRIVVTEQFKAVLQ